MSKDVVLAYWITFIVEEKTYSSTKQEKYLGSIWTNLDNHPDYQEKNNFIEKHSHGFSLSSEHCSDLGFLQQQYNLMPVL